MHPSPNVSRSSVIGCEAKYELSKKKVSRRNFCSVIQVFDQERDYIIIRFETADTGHRQKTEKIQSMTKNR